MKFRPIIYFLVLTGVFTLQTLAQTPKPTATPQPGDDSEIVKITTNLVQLDAVVTDKKGEPVTKLTASDFEIYQDGELQKLTNFSFVDTSVGKRRKEVRRKTNKNQVIPPMRSRMNTTGRVITFVVDDGSCSASAIGMNATRNAMKKYINEQMQPDDLVAIYRTMPGRSLMRQYTSDRALLLNIVKKIKWRPLIGCTSTGALFNAERQWETITLRNDPEIDGITDER